MTNLDTIIDETLITWARPGFIWGVNDCGMSVAAFVKRCCGCDPAVYMRDKYNSRRTCYTWIRNVYGNLVNMANAGFEKAGLLPASRPARGVVGVVKFTNSRYYIIAMCVDGVNNIWAARIQGGVQLEVPEKILTMWEMPCLL